MQLRCIWFGNTAATLRVDDFAANRALFAARAPRVIRVDARQHPVTIHFLVDASISPSETLGKISLGKFSEKAISASAILMFAFTCQVNVPSLYYELSRRTPAQMSAVSKRGVGRHHGIHIPSTEGHVTHHTPAGLNHLTGRRIEDGPIIVGICAMDKKARSKPMTEMLSRLTSFAADAQPEFKVIYFGDETLLEKPVEEWPLCEALIAFFSKDFPLQKAQQYVTLRRPLVFNDLDKQELLFDRRDTYRILEEQGVPVPNYAIFNADEANDIDEQEEYLEELYQSSYWGMARPRRRTTTRSRRTSCSSSSTTWGGTTSATTASTG